MSPSEQLNTTSLHAAHLALGARMTAFAGYEMPVQYRDGILAEHRWTRAHAGLFDVSHMGPAFLTLTGDRGPDPHAAVAALVEPLVCGDIRGLEPGRLRYTLMMNRAGGVLDDLIIGRPAEPERQGELYLVVNAATKAADFIRLAAAAGPRAQLTPAEDFALIALQGPDSAAALGALAPDVSALGFMRFGWFELLGARALVSRSGYTGEDGFELLVRGDKVREVWDRLMSDERVRPVGLGARDSLRLEAGLPLYGHDLDADTSPIEAGLAFAVSRRRVEARDFPGAVRLKGELGGGLLRARAGLRVLEGAPAREGAVVLGEDGQTVGVVTSGGFGPSVGGPIAMGLVRPAAAEPGTRLHVVVRGQRQPAEVVALPFVPHRYFRPA
jgi:aminomethyltransferase